MRNFLLRLIANAAALAATAAILPGIHIHDQIGTLLLVALIFGIVNALLKPIIIIMSCPLIILTLGLFAIVINGIMLLITSAIAGDRFTIDGFWWAVLGGLIVGIISSALEGALGVNDKNKKDKEDVIIFSR
jgi:putative membrane protein